MMIEKQVRLMAKKKTKKKTVSQKLVAELASTLKPISGTSPAFTANDDKKDVTPPQVEVKNQYIITINRNDTLPSIPTLKKKDILGVVIEAGYLYTSTHKEVSTFKNPRLDGVMNQVAKHSFPFGFYFNARGTSISEIRKEIYELSFVIRKYPPQLGVWLKLDLTTSKSINDKLLEYYYEKLSELGLVGQVGLYVKESVLDTITWGDFQDDWWLWLIKKYTKKAQLSAKLDPSLFDIGDE